MATRSNQDRRELALRKYFAHPPPPLLQAIGVGFWCVSALGVVFWIKGILLALALAGIGVLFYYLGDQYHKGYLAGHRDMPTDQQVQSWLDDDFRKLVAHSQQRLGISEEEVVTEPLLITGPIAWQISGANLSDVVWKRGTDGVARFGIYKAMIVHLTDRHLAVYGCNYNFLRGVPLAETSTEFHYHDVVAVSTREESSSYKLPTGQKLTSVQEFRVSAVSGEAVGIAVDAYELRRLAGAETLPESGAERALQTIRAMLRDKKRQANEVGAGRFDAAA